MLARTMDRFVEAISPVHAVERMEARAVLGGDHGFEGREPSNPTVTSANSELLQNLDLTRNRCRQLASRNPIAKAIRRVMADNTVGPGIKPKSSVDHEQLGWTPDGAIEWQDACNRWWERCQKHADVRGQKTFYELQKTAYLEIFDGGDVLAGFPAFDSLYRPQLSVVNFVEAERLKTPPDKESNKRFKGGVQENKWGRPIGYHILREHPGDDRTGPDKFEFWRAWVGKRRNIIHLSNVDRGSASRGTPMLKPCVPLLSQIGSYAESEIYAKDLASRWNLWIEVMGNTQDFQSKLKINRQKEAATKGGASYRDLQGSPMTRGGVHVLNAGDTIKSLGPSASQTYDDTFVQRLMRVAGSPYGVPYELFSNDLSSATFSSMRTGITAFKKTIEGHQTVIEPFNQTYWEHLMLEAWLMGELPRSIGGKRINFDRDKHILLRAVWKPPVLGTIDETKQIPAYVVAVKHGLMTRGYAMQQLFGVDHADHCRREKDEQECREKHGLDPVGGTQALVGAAPGADVSTQSGAGPAPAPEPAKDQKKKTETPNPGVDRPSTGGNQK